MFDILSNSPKVLVQGISGKFGRIHTAAMLQAGTRVVAGVVPGSNSTEVHGVPVYDTISEALRHTEIDVSVVFVPPAFCKHALLEAVDAHIPVVICITEGVPVHDFLAVKQAADKVGVRIVGPNCPGILLPGQGKFGIIPTSVGLPGNVGIVSRSGTLAYEVAHALTVAGIGQRAIVGIGGDSIKGTTFVDCLQFFQADKEIQAIVLVGEIGGHDEVRAADYIAAHVSKPVFSYIAGYSAPVGKQLGHAGAIIKSGSETASAKAQALAHAGARTARSVDELVVQVVDFLA